MSDILEALDSGDPLHCGGKAASLSALLRAGFHVPAFVTIPAEADLHPSLLDVVRQRLGDGLFAVRSSSRDEDGIHHSFAGQFATYLDVPADELVEKILLVRDSARSQAILLYAAEKCIQPPSIPAVVIMKMIEARAAGVCFSVDPVSGRRMNAVVSACEGTGEKLVSGEVDGETWSISREGTIDGKSVILSPEQAHSIASLAWRCEEQASLPQDIEWVIDVHGKLWLLQSRPITTLGKCPDVNDTLRVFDNSNIAESYSGITTPMTFSFARRIYEAVYREFCVLLGVPRKRILAADDVFSQMLGMVRGRVYYNLLSWYRVLALLPGFNVNRHFMEQMMGVKEPLPELLVNQVVKENQRGRWADRWDLVKTCLGLIRNYVSLRKQIAGFRHRLSLALDTPLPKLLDGEGMVHDYRRLEGMLLKKWDAPLVNDFFAMIFHGILRAMCMKFFPNQAQLVNELMADCGDIISAEPPRRICRMAAIVTMDPELARLLAHDHATLEKKLEAIEKNDAVFHEWKEYLQRFGDRCLEELKLESANVSDDPSTLLRSIGLLALQDRREGENPIRRTFLPAMPWHRKMIFSMVLNQTRRLVRNRENLRFERTRLFGRVRRLIKGLGHILKVDGMIDDANDVFYLEIGELLAIWEGTGTTNDLRGIVSSRKMEFLSFHQMTEPPDRIVCQGPMHRYQDFPIVNHAIAHQNVIHGVGACAGIVRGKVRVVLDPRNVVMRPGEIIVARQTDPGWVVLFPAAAGLLVERGSLLSHSAIVSRELRLPCVVSLRGITQILHDGDEVEMDGGTGTVKVLS